MSDTSLPPDFPTEDSPSDSSSELVEKRTWRRVFKFLKWDLIVSNSVAVLTTSIVAVTAMYATLSTTDKNLQESRRGARVSALVDEWSVTIADAAAAIELLDQRASDLWAFGAAYEQQGVILNEAMENETALGLGGEGTPEEKTSPSSFAASLFVLIGLATAITTKALVKSGAFSSFPALGGFFLCHFGVMPGACDLQSPP